VKEKQVAIIGAGSWGTALSIIAARDRRSVRLWAHRAETVESINKQRENALFLPAAKIPENVLATNSLEEALQGADIVISATPSHICRHIFTQMLPWLRPQMILVSATKGIENDTHMRMSEVARDVLRDHFEPRFVALSGPSFAVEVARRDPTAIVAASHHEEWSKTVQAELSLSHFRIYTNNDVVGVELGGSVKNVIAIAAGVVKGLGYGYNTAAAIITRGLAEITRLAVAQGGRVETMAGLAGVGDLMLTCTGELSRNRRVGVELGKGRKLEEIVSEMRAVAEGIRTTKAVYELGRKIGIELPITASVHALLYQGKSAQEAAAELMGRPLKRE